MAMATLMVPTPVLVLELAPVLEHCIEQVAFVARLAAQLPSIPLAGAVTLHDASAAVGPNGSSDAGDDSSNSNSKDVPKGREHRCGLHIGESRSMACDRRDCDAASHASRMIAPRSC